MDVATQLPQPQVDPNSAAISAALADQPLDLPVAPDNNGQAAGKDVQVATEPTPVTPPSGATPPAPATEPAKPEPTALDKALGESLFGESKPAEIDDAFKGKFKEFFGTDDVLGFKESLGKTSTEIDLLKADAQEGQQWKQFFDRANPALVRALQLERDGQSGESLKYLRSMPDEILLNKEAKDLSPEQLIKTYLPGKVSEDTWAALTDENADDSVRDAAKQVVSMYKDVAANMHSSKREQILQETKTYQEQFQATRELFDKAVVESIAKAKNDKVVGIYITPEVIDTYRQTLDQGLLTKEDGVTPHPDRLLNLMKATRHDEIVARVKVLAYDKGKADGLLEATSKLPTGPRGAGRDVAQAGDAPQIDPNHAAIAQALGSR